MPLILQSGYSSAHQHLFNFLISLLLATVWRKMCVQVTQHVWTERGADYIPQNKSIFSFDFSPWPHVNLLFLWCPVRLRYSLGSSLSWQRGEKATHRNDLDLNYLQSWAALYLCPSSCQLFCSSPLLWPESHPGERSCESGWIWFM